MDSLQFEAYTSYSSASTPRTPSPNDMSYNNSPPHFKPSLDLEPIRNIFDPPHDDSIVHHPWQQPHQVPYPNSRGSLMQELYDSKIGRAHV